MSVGTMAISVIDAVDVLIVMESTRQGEYLDTKATADHHCPSIHSKHIVLFAAHGRNAHLVRPCSSKPSLIPCPVAPVPSPSDGDLYTLCSPVHRVSVVRLLRSDAVLDRHSFYCLSYAEVDGKSSQSSYRR